MTHALTYTYICITHTLTYTYVRMTHALTYTIIAVVITTTIISMPAPAQLQCNYNAITM